MIERAEAQAQLARLLGDESLRVAALDTVRAAVRAGHARLAEGLADEAAESDDVLDKASALDYLDRRLQGLSELVDDASRARVMALAQERIERW